jgi:hypothetical protein
MLWTIFVVILILWLLGFSLHIGGGLIHLLLVVALVVLVINLVSGRRAAGRSGNGESNLPAQDVEANRGERHLAANCELASRLQSRPRSE